MERRKASRYILGKLITDDKEDGRKPKFSTLTSDWITADRDPVEHMEAVNEFLGIKLKVSRTTSVGYNVAVTNVKLRIINKFQYEPFLEENEKRVSDVVQIYPKKFVFDPPAELVLKLPSCVGPETCGQLVCMYCGNRWLRHGAKHLKWRPMDSQCLHINTTRTEARIMCKRSGLYTIKVTQHRQITKKLTPYSDCELKLTEYQGIQIKFFRGCVAEKMYVTLETISSDQLYSEPTPVAISASRSCDKWFPLRNFNPDDLNTWNMVDVTSSPVVLIRPSRHHFIRPIQLTIPLLGGAFTREDTKIVVLMGKVVDLETISWKYHYSTPEVETTESGSQVAAFLITRGGLYKVVRRFANNQATYLKHISDCISREIGYGTSNNKRHFVTASLRGLMTEIAEPGKQFVLRIALFDSSQPKNPDLCFVSEVCCQPLSLPLGKTRFLVRGSFEPDRDAADHSEERIVMYTGKTMFVDFYLKLRLNDPTKLPDGIGKVSIHGAEDVQFYINLHKPTPIKDLDNPVNGDSGLQEITGKRRLLMKRQISGELSPLRKVEDPGEKDLPLSPETNLTYRPSLPLLAVAPLTNR
ncbi:uncharacterized protein [Montipora capricornis]|uniref:uncharacterized protein n=1 Tax=Montipora capricornis TaxID=246305 RepID=UPI0035F1B0DE